MSTASHPLVSVVVPVYNVEQYLGKCLDSLVKQSLDEIEIIVVNDGSTDGSQGIIDFFAEQYPDKIYAFRQPNGGQASARNLGISKARAGYIGFIDSDDYAELNMFKDLYDHITRNDCEVAICQYKHYHLYNKYGNYKRGEIHSFAENTVYHGRDFLCEARLGLSVNKLYKKTLIQNHIFPNIWYEDVAWTMTVMSYVTRLCYIQRPYYNYIGREGSVVESRSNLRTLEGIAAVKYGYEHCKPEEKAAAAVFVLRRLLSELKWRPGYADNYAAAINSFRDDILASAYIYDYPELYYAAKPFLENYAAIPKTLYYDSFGVRPHTEAQKRCIASWSETMIYADGDILCLNEENCDVNENPVVSKLYAQGQYDLVGHYFKLKKLSESGGVALSRHMEGRGFIAPLLNGSRVFFAFSDDRNIQTGIYGSMPGQEIIQQLAEDILRTNAQEAFNSIVLDNCGNSTKIYDSGLFTCDFGDGAGYTRDTFFLDKENPGFANSAVFYIKAQYEYSIGSNAAWELKSEKLMKKINTAKEECEKEREAVKKLREKSARLEKEIKSQNKKIEYLELPFYVKAWRKLKRMFSKKPEALAPVAASPFKAKPAAKKDAALEAKCISNFNKLDSLSVAYADFINKLPVDPRLVLLEDSDLCDFFEEWGKREDFASFSVVCTAPALPGGNDNVLYADKSSADYFKYLASAKYLVNSGAFSPYFVKRPEQVVGSKPEDSEQAGSNEERKKRVLLYAGSMRSEKSLRLAKIVADSLGIQEYDVFVVFAHADSIELDMNIKSLLDMGIRPVSRQPRHLVRSREESYAHTKLASEALTPEEAEHARVSFRREWRRCFGDSEFDIGICLFDDTLNLFYANLFALAPIKRKVLCLTRAAEAAGQAKKLSRVLKPFDFAFGSVRELIESHEWQTLP